MLISSRRAVVFAVILACFVGASLSLFLAFWKSPEELQQEHATSFNQTRQRFAAQLSQSLAKGELPETLDVDTTVGRQTGKAQYTIVPELQNEAERLLKSYKPDYAAMVMMDASSGRILALASWYKNQPEESQNLALLGTFPAASIFKIVTATAAVDKYSVDPSTIILFNGSNHTLYKRNVMTTNHNRWTRGISLREAFARSVNTAFGRLTFERMQPEDLEEYAIRFGFNQNIISDVPFQPGFIEVPHEKNYHLAEVASGFNRITTMSPVQGAMIAGSVIMDGTMRVPYLVEKVTDHMGEVLFQAEPVTAATTMSPEGAERLKELMGATISHGTSRKSFKPLTRNRKFRELEVGGKTGSLQGTNPKGKTDWFVGYGMLGDQRVSVAAVTVNKQYWTVKSSHLAQHMLQRHFKESFTLKNGQFFAEDRGE
jgi:cell division protein FtsI/penicillin-binding protein 2